MRSRGSNGDFHHALSAGMLKAPAMAGKRQPVVRLHDSELHPHKDAFTWL